MIPIQYALRRRMMINVSKELSISDLPLGTLIRIADSDGGAGDANYEIADINNFVSGGVVLVRKNIYSNSQFGSNTNYPSGTLDNLIKTTIYNEMPQKLRDKMMDVSFNLSGSGDITRKMFALTYTMAGFGNNNGVAEGKALQLYTSDASRIKTFNGSEADWWLSSQLPPDYAGFVSEGGYLNGSRRPSDTYGVVPAFAIPGDELCNDTPNPDGSYNLLQNTTISDLPLGALINVGTDGGAGAPNYEIADKDNLVSGGVVLVRKNIHSKSEFGSSTYYPGSTLDNTMTSIYNSLPEKLQSKIMDATFALLSSGSITRKVFALTYTMTGFGENHGTAEGKALQLYTSNENRIKKYNGSADNWWLSSPEVPYAHLILTDGAASYHGRPNPHGVVPAFVIPANAVYGPTPNADGSYNLIY